VALKPFKVCILGPPGVGKSTIAQQLAKEYKLHHIHVKDVITQAIDNLNKLAKRAEAEADKPGGEKEEGGEEEEEDADEDEEELPDLDELETINENMEANNGRLDDTYVLKYFKQRLLSKPCQNQGFVLDGFPKTRDQALSLFERRLFLYSFIYNRVVC
jgi:adenylate kinase